MSTEDYAYTIQQAIETSIRENVTITIESKLDTARWVGLGAALDAVGECTETREEGDLVHAYTGHDRDGDEWAVTLRAYP